MAIEVFVALNGTDATVKQVACVVQGAELAADHDGHLSEMCRCKSLRKAQMQYNAQVV